MITTKRQLLQKSRWQRELADAITDPEELLGRLGLPSSLADEWAMREFSLRVPEAYLRRMEPGNPADPLLRQVLPIAEERQRVAGYHRDPVGDRNATVVPGLLQKYAGRVLLIACGACAIHCRYCFRRHFPYQEGGLKGEGWERVLSHVASDTTIEEVIFSGGDPWLLSDRRLAEMVRLLASIPHVRRLRFHTRLPVVLPSRVDEALLDWLTATSLQQVVVIHANHPAELDDAVVRALRRLAGAGVTLLNQSVLLRGVNEQVAVLKCLSEQLFTAGVLPYYLHLPDRVAGAAHFELTEEQGLALLAELRRLLPGYLVPRLVREEAGEPAKRLVCQSTSTGGLDDW